MKDLFINLNVRDNKNNLVELRDILNIFDKCYNNNAGIWILNFYDFNGINEGREISESIVQYLNSEQALGLQLPFTELYDFSRSIFQTIECKVTANFEKSELKISCFDSNFWEIVFTDINDFQCFKSNMPTNWSSDIIVKGS